MIFEFGDYRISPYSGNTCWKIQERASEDSKEEWNQPYYFPSTFKSAVLAVRDLTLRKSHNDESSVLAIDEAFSLAVDIDTKLLEALNSLSFEVPSDLKN